MSVVRNFKAARNNPTPDLQTGWNFRLWSYGFMKPLHCIPHTITVNNTPQSLLDIFIPANTWATFKRLIVWADVSLHQNNPPHPGGRQYGEAYNIQGIGVVPRTGPSPIANSATDTRYVIQRQFQYEAGTDVYEENFDIQGNTSIAAAANADHRINVVNIAGVYDNTVDAYLQLIFANTFAGSMDVMQVHTAQAFVQAPLNLNRLPQ